MQTMAMTTIPVAAFAAWIAYLAHNMLGNNRHELRINNE
jgi:hypothetical protein